MDLPLVPLVRSLRAGGGVYGIAMIGFGLVALIRLDTVPSLEPLDTTLPIRPLLGILSAGILIVSGFLLALDRQAQRAALVAAAFLSLWLVLLHVPYLVVHPRRGGAWVSAFEVVAISAAGWTLAASLMLDDADAARRARWRRIETGARVAFGVSLIAFGISHFVYHEYVESVIPAWVPAHPFWAYGIGVAFIAAGVSMVTRIQARLAAALLTVQFGTWVAILHWPRVVAHPMPNEWTSLLVAVAMCGGSWIVSGSLARPRRATEDAGVAYRDAPIRRRQLTSL